MFEMNATTFNKTNEYDQESSTCIMKITQGENSFFGFVTS